MVTYKIPEKKEFYKSITVLDNSRLLIRTVENTSFSWALPEGVKWEIKSIEDTQVDGVHCTEVNLEFQSE